MWSDGQFKVIEHSHTNYELRDGDCNTVAKFRNYPSAIRYVVMEFKDFKLGESC